MRGAEEGSIVEGLDCAFVVEIVDKYFFSCFPVHGIKF